jgi:hypothetical protein
MLWLEPEIFFADITRQKPNIARVAIEIIHGSGNVVISKESDEIWRDFGAGVCHKFNMDKITCFKVISQVSLVDANP